MEKQHYIKDLYENDELSLNEIAKRTGLSFKTIQKYAYKEDWNGGNRKEIKPERYKVLGDYLEIIDEWLLNDKKEPRKQRHTIKRVYDRLTKEHDFAGSYGSVKKYFNKKKKLDMQAKLAPEAALPMEHPMNHAEIDFGKMKYYDKFGKAQKGYALTVSFPYSNMAFTQVFQSENQECLLEGLKRIFEHIGGVPKVIRADNMATAVAHVLKGTERELTEGFRRFMLHYRFSAEFCNPAAGNEKGNVENKVGYSRRNFFVPVPIIEDFEEYNKHLFEICESDGDRLHYKKQCKINELWQEEKQKLLTLPENEYHVFRYESVNVSKDGFIIISKRRYSVPSEYSSTIVQIKIFVDKIEVYADGCQVKTTKRIYNDFDESIDWRDYVNLLSRKPRGVENTRFFNQMPKLWQEHLKNTDGKERKNALILLSEIVSEGNDSLCDEVIQMARECGRIDSDSIRQCYYMSSKREHHPKPVELDSGVIQIFYNPDLLAYDKLTGGAFNE